MSGPDRRAYTPVPAPDMDYTIPSAAVQPSTMPTQSPPPAVPPRPPRPPAPPTLPKGARPPINPSSPSPSASRVHGPSQPSPPPISPARSTWSGFPSPSSHYFDAPFRPRPPVSNPQSPRISPHLSPRPTYQSSEMGGGQGPPMLMPVPQPTSSLRRPLPAPPPLSTTTSRQPPIYSPSAWSPLTPSHSAQLAHSRSASASSLYLSQARPLYSTTPGYDQQRASQAWSDQGEGGWTEPSSWSFSSSTASFDTFPGVEVLPEVDVWGQAVDGFGRLDLEGDVKVQRESVVVDELLQHRLFEEDGIQRFQSGSLDADSTEWHKLVPPSALSALPKKDVQRQSIIFEIIKSERDYVMDLQAVQDVFIAALRQADPPVVGRQQLDGFLLEVFSNLAAVRGHHERMLSRLFERQREQHPFVLSVADIVLDGALRSTQDYEIYIKHYPLAEARHRRELKQNPAYSALLSSCAEDKRIRKRDLITFLSRPVTRLPRLSLLLENMARQTDPSHQEDAQTTELILSVLRDFVKSTQPGIAAADAKVKFWSLCETLVFRRGEILDMDLYDEKRTLVHSGGVVRRKRQDLAGGLGVGGQSWVELYVGLLDNYLLITQQESHMGNVKHVVVSRPIPLQYLRLGSFTSPPESRRLASSSLSASSTEARSPPGVLPPLSLPLSLLGQQQQLYPFTIYHAVERGQRRYTLFAETEGKRERWREALVDALGVMSVQQEANRWFALNPLSTHFFRFDGKFDLKRKLPGPIICAASFVYNKRDLVAVGCAEGVWVGYRGDGRSYRKVLNLPSVISMSVLPNLPHLIIHHSTSLSAYSLLALARVASGETPSLQIYNAHERVGKPDEPVAFFRAGEVAGKVLVVYAVKRPLRTTLVQCVEARDPARAVPEVKEGKSGKGGKGDKGGIFVSYGQTFYVPKDAYDIVLLQKKIAICTDKGLTIHDPTDMTNNVPILVPDFSSAATDKAVASLKTRCEAMKPLGMVRSGETELLVVYEEFGCYITKHGVPARRSGYVRWEIKATSVVFRAPHVLLFDNDFVEVREVRTGRLEQVIEGKNVRLIGDLVSTGPLLVAIRGETVDGATSDVLAELVQTQALSADERGLWDEWGLW